MTDEAIHIVIFKADIQKFADEIGVKIKIAHYPSYASVQESALLISILRHGKILVKMIKLI
ncbi:MAG: hypothetical protein HF982_07595 [Desulfobacteraceae bacterium]|nr:hypothetical protein [Desulfobacteraceae bacterium]MBC2719434.1 hypothetical protein [Desulfobacteraceae bacterium]